MTLADFLLARIAEDEAVARDCERAYLQPLGLQSDYDHQQRWAPGRVLAECEAKRRIVERHEWNRTPLMRECDTYSWATRVLGGVYADHPDYRDEWRP